MNMNKPQFKEYKEWLKDKHEIEISDKTKNHYGSVTERIKNDFGNSEFWTQLTKNLNEYGAEYYRDKNYELFMPRFETELYIKSFNSFFKKTFRKNVVENKNWPKKPEEGWILPNNWFTRINDIIRTIFVVKYLDGVRFMKKKISSLCDQCIMKSEVHWEAREEGYYAVHLYTKQEFEIPRIDWDTEKIDFIIEIQITTQLQEAIRKLLHKYYEKRREEMREEDVKWQWNYESDEFILNYLGHILHYVEGMIMDIREKQMEETL